MPEVDPDDDSIVRHVVFHYRYDPARRERRNVVVGAWDTAAEYDAAFARVAAEVARRRTRPDGDPLEQSSGMTWEPGHRQRAANGRLVSRMFRHGAVDLDVIARLELPSNMGITTARIDDEPDPPDPG